jgi:uncharacterized surface protein with fasciclin (FAS1) repeats
MKRLAVLLGITALTLAVVPSALAASKPTQSIVEIATANGSFKTLLAAVGCADPAVGTALTGKGPLTVFAPTDAAFAAANLTPDNVCTALPQATLTKVLLYHVVPGNLPASKVLSPTKAGIRVLKTALGQRIAVNYAGTLFTTSGGTAKIMVPEKLYNIAATNGTIHVVDSVLMPAL